VNGSSTVSPDIQDAVRRAVDELGYVPNPAARSLVTQRTDSIALVVSESPTRVFSDDPFFSATVRGISLELEAADRQLVLMLTGSAPGYARVERYVNGGHVDGVLLLSLHVADPLPGILARKQMPAVIGGRPLGPGTTLHYVDNDNIGGAERAVRHLLDGGRRRIATITGPQDMSAGIDRLAGYRHVLADSGRRSIVAEGAFTRESGAQAMAHLLEDDPALDAVFVANDMMAIGALHALRAAGRRVPDDVAVVGFDDNELARYAQPPLTTVRQDMLEMGREMVRQVLPLVAGRDPGPPVVLPTELIVRESA
jgi:DNA-binding LacI/PurR family transcriptional regulator